MEQNLRLELAEMVEPAEWQWLTPHVNRGAVVVVDSALDLVEVGVAIATDDVSRVNRWVAEALLTKPNLAQINAWERANKKRVNALIVQPFVLVQDFAAA